MKNYFVLLNKFIFGSISISVVFINFVLFNPNLVNAETHITNNDLLYGGIWNKAGSPYILDEDVYVPEGYLLDIEKGVTIMSASLADTSSYSNSLNFERGDLLINGTMEEPVIFDKLHIMHFFYSNAEIKNAIFDNTSLDFSKSTSTISYSTMKNSDKAISAEGSNLLIDHSKILKNKTGIASYKPGVYQVNNVEKNEYGIGGIGNALEDMAPNIIDYTQNIISIHNSSIVGNGFGISQETKNTLDARNNWWGDTNGPSSEIAETKGDYIDGLVDFSSWLTRDPDVPTVCCSNVLFLPGIEASRLYKDTTGPLGTGTNRLWEPNSNDDLKKMYMNSNGKSIDSSIYTSDIINSAFLLKPIYRSFIAMMNSVVADKTINSWLPFPYDWRMSVEDIVNGRTVLGTTTISLIEETEKLAKNSKTGKVVIVAHSNGGLLAKVLMKALEAKGEGEIVEKVISVAVPELGTPQAILGMLHGYDQSILDGLVISENNARTFSQNLPGAYGLLPSRKFFEKNPITVISDMFSNSSNIFVDTYEKMKNFLIKNPFSKTSSTDTNIPLLLNQAMIPRADYLHTAIDSWKPASTTKTLTLFGWGMPTTESVEYEKEKHCIIILGINCGVSFAPIFTDAGDGTVLADSNAGISDISYFLNLKDLKKDTKKEIKHADILESTDALNLIKDQVSNAISATDYGKYITTTEPVDTDKWLTIKIYSPVDIDVYDKEGNHTGLIENPVVGKDLEKFENNIPLSFYGDYGKIKLVRLLYGEDYQIVLKGNDSGVFSADAKVEQFDKVITTTTFGDMPVTPLMNVDLVISTSTSSFATSSEMIIDMDGDGTTDFINHSDEFLNSTSTATTTLISDLPTYIESMKKVIISLKLSPREEEKWLKRIDQIIKAIEKKHSRKAEIFVKKLSNKRFKNKTLTSAQRTAILSVFKNLINRIEIDYKIDL